MELPRLRLQKDAMAYIREKDPENALKPYALRQLIITGVIPTVSIGRKKLVNLDVLESYMCNPESFACPAPTGTNAGIRHIG